MESHGMVTVIVTVTARWFNSGGDRDQTEYQTRDQPLSEPRPRTIDTVDPRTLTIITYFLTPRDDAPGKIPRPVCEVRMARRVFPYKWSQKTSRGNGENKKKKTRLPRGQRPTRRTKKPQCQKRGNRAIGKPVGLQDEGSKSRRRPHRVTRQHGTTNQP